MLNNRQGNNNRRRGRNNNNQRPQGSGQSRDNGNRIDNRARGNAPQLLEKYKTLARDAQMQGDRVLTEYYHQFADHYFRVVAEMRQRFEENQPRRQRDDWDNGDGAESQGNGNTSYDSDEDGDDRSFDDSRHQQPQPQQRYQRPQPAENNAERGDAEDEGREERSGFEERLRPDRAPRTERPQRTNRNERPRERAAQADAEPERADPPLTLDFNVLPPSIAVQVDTGEGTEAAAPKRRGRPKKVVAEAE